MMKNLTVYIAISLLLPGCWLSDHEEEKEVSSDMISNPHSAYKESGEVAALEVDTQTVHFGKIAEGEKVKHTFNFTNTGEKPLVISAVEPSCGCTVPENWPKEPISPGESGKIEVVYDSDGDRGKQHKSVSVVANTSPSTTVLALEGEVMAPSNQE